MKCSVRCVGSVCSARAFDGLEHSVDGQRRVFPALVAAVALFAAQPAHAQPGGKQPKVLEAGVNDHPTTKLDGHSYSKANCNVDVLFPIHT